jgi:antitoxin (DNA-binding transcriptional repressor) of toxin-antitoxin stability system
MNVHIVHMVAENIATSRSNMSALLKQVQAGETVIILDRGIPVARFEPVDSWNDETYKLMAAKLTKAGDLFPRKAALGDDFFDMPLPDDRKGGARAALIAERRDGR